MGQKQKTKQVIMTEGVIWKQLLAFSMPLLVGNLFQQLYNTVDSIVVGNFSVSEALAAVGSSNSLINLIIGMFMGIATGAGVIISQYYGAKDDQKLHWAVHTCMALSLIGGTLLIVLGVILVYYIAATLLPVDKIIGRIYPVFGFALLFMAVGILVVLLFGGEYTIPEFTSFENCIADAKAFPIVPMLFTTIACGAISGFHATQSPLMARCMRNERESRSVFYGAMISESIIALVWSAIAMAVWGDVAGLNGAIDE